MIRFDPTLGHSLICMQANTGVPEDHRECVCQVSVIEHASETSRRTYRTMPTIVAPTFVPDYELDGPFDFADRMRSRWLRFLIWLRNLAITVAVVGGMSFITGALLRYFGVIQS